MAVAGDFSADMMTQERKCSAMRSFASILVVMLTCDAAKCVITAFVGVNRDQRVILQMALDLLLHVKWNEFILFCHVHHQRLSYWLVDVFIDCNSVVTHVGISLGPGCHQECHLPSEAKTDRCYLAVATG